MTIRIILKNGVEFSIQCEEFNLERERLTGILVGWTAKGVTENKPVYIDMNQIAAVVRVLSDESPEEKKAAAPAPVEEETRICCPYCGGDNKNAVVYEDHDNKEYFVFCETCGHETVEAYKTKARAIEAFVNGKNRTIIKDTKT